MYLVSEIKGVPPEVLDVVGIDAVGAVVLQGVGTPDGLILVHVEILVSG